MDEHEIHNDHWKSDYLLTNNNNKLQYITCMKVISVPKEYNMKRNYTKLHEKTFGSK